MKPISQQPDHAYLSYFKLTLFDPSEFIVWNIYGLRHLVLRKLVFKNPSFWQRLNSLDAKMTCIHANIMKKFWLKFRIHANFRAKKNYLFRMNAQFRAKLVSYWYKNYKIKSFRAKPRNCCARETQKPPISHEDVSYNSSILMLLNLFAFLLRLKQKFKFLADLQFYFTVFKNMLNIEKIRDKFL